MLIGKLNKLAFMFELEKPFAKGYISYKVIFFHLEHTNWENINYYFFSLIANDSHGSRVDLDPKILHQNTSHRMFGHMHRVLNKIYLQNFLHE